MKRRPGFCRGGVWALLACAVLMSWLPGGSLAEPSPDVDSNATYAISDVTAEEVAGETVIGHEASPEFVPWLLDVARGELGYKEGAQSYTKYGEWAGDPHAQWCAEFVCWCVDQVDKQHGTQLLTVTYPKYSGQNVGKEWYIARGRFVFRKGNCPDWGYQWLLGSDQLMKKNDYIPRPGDLMFFSYNEAGDTEHVALVEYSAMDAEGNVVIHVIEGNNPSSVQRNAYRLSNSQVLGFGACADVVGTTMRSGNRGDKVKWLQESLHELGILDEQHITGAYGANTRIGVEIFQESMEGKTVNGIADMETQNALIQALIKKEYDTPETWLVVDE